VVGSNPAGGSPFIGYDPSPFGALAWPVLAKPTIAIPAASEDEAVDFAGIHPGGEGGGVIGSG